ncbi:hypothetical protein [Nocardia sp. BMG51109]|uniref:hypothetical protein n=1 Tax=Nocardia sp. BMG51109 TaxID=1056816 RepID=UPI000464941E|nr:hypothetical protein [Nocardia sp. BMG51109]
MVSDVVRRKRNVQTGIRAALVALPVAIAITGAGVAMAAPGPGQPGVTSPQAEQNTEQPAELRPAAPQNSAPAPKPQAAPRPAPKPEEPEAPPAPEPRSVRIGEFRAPVPDAVPNEVVDGVNRTAEGLQNALVPGAPQAQPEQK